MSDDLEFYRALDRLRDEGTERWRHEVRYGPNGETVKQVRFINRENERPTQIPRVPLTGRPL